VQVRLHPGLQVSGHDRPGDPLRDGGDAEPALAATRLGNRDPPHRERAVDALAKLRLEPVEEPADALFADRVDSRSSAGGRRPARSTRFPTG
jgi:hypothetical protein